jgi:hypothetical protein
VSQVLMCPARLLTSSRSKQLTQPVASHATKLSTIQANAGLSQKEDSQSQKEESGGSSPRSDGAHVQCQAFVVF